MSGGAWLVFAALGVIWGIPYYLIKIALLELPPLAIVWLRLLLSATVLVPVAWRRGALAQARRHPWAITSFAVIEFTIPFVAITAGEQWISSSITGMLIAMVPMMVALISRLFGVHEALGWVRVTGLLTGFAGVVALVGFGSVSGPLGWLGVACMAIAALGYAIGPLIVKRHLSDVDSYGPVAASIAVAALLLTPWGLASLPGEWPSGRVMLSVAVLGAVCTALGMLLMFRLIRVAGPGRATVITYVNPAVATLLGVWLLDEHLGWSGMVGFALILGGSWLATRPARAA